MEDTKQYNRLVFASTTFCDLDDAGFWTVVAEIKSSRKGTDGPWDERRISAKSIDKNLDRAQRTVVLSLARKMEDLEQNLFNLSEEESMPDVQTISKNN